MVKFGNRRIFGGFFDETDLTGVEDYSTRTFHGKADNGISERLNVQGFNVMGRPIVGCGSFRMKRKDVLENARALSDHQGYSIIARMPVGDIHFVQASNNIVRSMADLTMDSPFIIRFLSDDENREKVLNVLCDDGFLNEVSRFVVGPSQRVKAGRSRRYSFADLQNFVEKRVPLDVGADGLLVISRVIYECLLPLDLHYNSLEMFVVDNDDKRLMAIDDVRQLVKEMEIRDAIGNVEKWRDKRVLIDVKSGDEIWFNVVKNSLSVSMINFKTMLGSISLFNLKFDAVMLCARMALASQIGVKGDFKDLLIADAATSDANVQRISRWFVIIEEFLDGSIFDEQSLSTEYARGMSIDVISNSAEKIVSAIENHPLVERTSIAELNQYLDIEHSYIGNGSFHWHTKIRNRRYGEIEASVFNEFNVADSIYRPERNRVATGVISSVYERAGLLTDRLSQLLGDVDSIRYLGKLGQVNDTNNVINQSFGLLSVYNVDPRMLLLRCVTTYSVHLWYSKDKLDGKVAWDRIDSWCFSVPRPSNSVITALEVVNADLLVDDLAVAAFLLPAHSQVSSTTTKDDPNMKTSLVFGRDFISAVAELENTVQMDRYAKGTVALDINKQAVKGNYQVDLDRVLYVSQTLNNYILLSRGARHNSCLLDCIISTLMSALEEKGGPKLADVELIEIRQQIGLALVHISESFRDVAFYNNIRRSIMDTTARSINPDSAVWANHIHSLTLKSATNIAALRLISGLLNIDRESVALLFSKAYSLPQIGAMLYQSDAADRLINIDANRG